LAQDLLVLFFLKGIAVGLVIAVPAGPVGVLCVRRTVFDGPLTGFISGLGAASADTVFGIIAGFGLTVVQSWLLDWQNWLRAGGGAFLVWIGITALRKRPADAGKSANGSESFFGAYATTFALTISNPLTILAFLGVFAAVGVSGHEATLAAVGMLVAGVLAGSLLWWIGLSLGAGLIRDRFRDVHLLWLNRISGAILALSGVALLVSLALP
jgi:threonine/homoserine/homoserine lactone efflux protein